ncbi:hypothetical protein ACA910_006618 [Epithemia clementina (nom. ined.)]
MLEEQGSREDGTACRAKKKHSDGNANAPVGEGFASVHKLSSVATATVGNNETTNDQTALLQQQIAELSRKLQEANKNLQVMKKKVDNAGAIITNSIPLLQQKEEENKVLHEENEVLVEENVQLKQYVAEKDVDLNAVLSKVS